MSLVSVQNGSKGVPAEAHAPAGPDPGMHWPWRLSSLAWQQSGQPATPLAAQHQPHVAVGGDSPPAVNKIVRST